MKEITVNTADEDTVKCYILSEENRTLELLSYTYSKGSRNVGLLNIPAEVIYKGDTYSITSISDLFKAKYYVNYYGELTLRSISSSVIINISNGVKYIDDEAFIGLFASEINLPPSLLKIGRSAFYSPDVETVELPPMSGGSFERFVSHNVNAPLYISNLVDRIRENTFDYCDFKSVTIGQNVKLIWSNAFGKVEKLICCATTPPEWKGEDPVIVDFSNTNLVVPPGCKEVYEQDENWSRAKSIEEYECYVNAEFENTDIVSHKILKGRIFKGQTRTLHPKITWLHEGSTERFRYWYSSDENVASVDQNGVVTAKDLGMATITFIIEDERGIPSSCGYEVTVTTSADVDILESEDTDNAVEVFTLNGLKVGDSTDNLPAGLYIVKSAKEAKKVCIK